MTKKIKCAYHLCKKDVEESKAIERMLHFMRYRRILLLSLTHWKTLKNEEEVTAFYIKGK